MLVPGCGIARPTRNGSQGVLVETEEKVSLQKRKRNGTKHYKIINNLEELKTSGNECAPQHSASIYDIRATSLQKILESWATPNWSKWSVGQKEFRSQIPKSQILNPKSLIQCPRSQIPNPKTSIPNSVSQVQILNSKSQKIWFRL